MDKEFQIYESRMNSLEEAKSTMRSGCFSKTHSLTKCRICSKNHKEEIDQMIKEGKPLRSIANRMNWLYEECGFYRVFPTEASLRRYVRHFYLKKDIEIREKHEEINTIYYGHIQTLELVRERAEKIARLEDIGKATHRDTINAWKLVNKVSKKVFKNFGDMKKSEVALTGRRFERLGL